MAQAFHKILAGHRPPRPSDPNGMRQGLWACVKACWRHNPATRPTAQKLFEFMSQFLSNPSILPAFPPTLAFEFEEIDKSQAEESEVDSRSSSGTWKRRKSQGLVVYASGGGEGILSKVVPFLDSEEEAAAYPLKQMIPAQRVCIHFSIQRAILNPDIVVDYKAFL